MKSKRRKYKVSEERIKRYKEICQKIESGKTYAKTARKYGLSLERIRQIYNGQGGDYHFIKEKQKEERAKQRERKYRSVFRIVKKHVQTIGYIPPYNELLKFLLKIRGTYYVSKIKEELTETVKLPQKIDIRRDAKREKMIQDLKLIYTIIQRPVGRKDLKIYGVWSYEMYARTFGSYKQACMQTGIPCPKKGGNNREMESGTHNVINIADANTRIDNKCSIIS
jgi:hypothetical protein